MRRRILESESNTPFPILHTVLIWSESSDPTSIWNPNNHVSYTTNSGIISVGKFEIQLNTGGNHELRPVLEEIPEGSTLKAGDRLYIEPRPITNIYGNQNHAITFDSTSLIDYIGILPEQPTAMCFKVMMDLNVSSDYNDSYLGGFRITFEDQYLGHFIILY